MGQQISIQVANAGFGVVVPAHQAAETLPRCIQGLRAAGFGNDEILVVDDGSRDATGANARKAGVRLIRNEMPLRPARARNAGARAISPGILLFVDADVVVHSDVRTRLEAHFGDPRVTAVIGSYDDAPPAPAVVSQYRNLLHHFTHQRASPDAGTFWTGLGAVRRDAFLAAGGFDPDWEDIEDVEFGLRLRAAGGSIRLDRELLGTHLKAWTLRSMLRTDYRGRALPWTRLLLARRTAAGELNTTAAHQVAAASVAIAALSLLLIPLVPAALAIFLLALLLFLVVNAGFLRLMARTHGAGFAVRAVPFHALHYLAALAGYARVHWDHVVRRRTS